MLCDGVHELKTITTPFSILVFPKTFEYLNELHGVVTLWSQTNTDT